MIYCNQEVKEMFEKLFPKQYGFSAFYVKVTPKLIFRVYKVEHLFSTVGTAHIFYMHISFRHLHKLMQFKWADKKTINFDCNVDTGINILKELKEKGFADVSHLFKG